MQGEMITTHQLASNEADVDKDTAEKIKSEICSGSDHLPLKHIHLNSCYTFILCTLISTTSHLHKMKCLRTLL